MRSLAHRALTASPCRPSRRAPPILSAPSHARARAGKSLSVRIAPAAQRDTSKVNLDASGRAVAPTASATVTSAELREFMASRAARGEGPPPSPTKKKEKSPEKAGGGAGAGGGGGAGGGNGNGAEGAPETAAARAARIKQEAVDAEGADAAAAAAAAAASDPHHALPLRATQKILQSLRVPPTMTLAMAALSNNALFRVVPRAAVPPRPADNEDEHDDGTKFDPQAHAVAERVAYASLGLLPPPAWSAPTGSFSGADEVQLDASKQAAKLLDPEATKRLNVELGLLGKRLETTNVQVSRGMRASERAGGRAGGRARAAVLNKGSLARSGPVDRSRPTPTSHTLSRALPPCHPLSISPSLPRRTRSDLRWV